MESKKKTHIRSLMKKIREEYIQENGYFMQNVKIKDKKIQFPLSIEIENTMEKTVYLFEYLESILKNECKDNNEWQINGIRHCIENIEEAIRDAYKIPDAHQLLEYLSECVEIIEEDLTSHDNLSDLWKITSCYLQEKHGKLTEEDYDKIDAIFYADE